MQNNPLTSKEEIIELKSLLTTKESILVFQDRIKSKVMSVLNVSCEKPLTIWIHKFILTMQDWVTWLLEPKTKTFIPNSQIVKIEWSQIKQFDWKNVVWVRIANLETYFSLDDGKFITPLNLALKQ